MKKSFFFVAFTLMASHLLSQQNARCGYTYSPNGEIRMLIVFADIVNDPMSDSIPQWLPGHLPEYANTIIDNNDEDGLISYISRYYKEVSFGTLHVTGDYYPYLLEFDTSEIQGNGINQVISSLNNLPDSDIITYNGHHLSDFDNWSFGSPREYQTKQQLPDNKLDILVIIWRRNSKYRNSRTGGSCYGVNINLPLKYLSGLNGYSILYCNTPSKTLRHEYGHTLIGGNAYHTGGAGTLASGHFLSSVGGYSLLSSHNCNLEFCNGWDRWRLGWKHPSKVYEISALDINGNEINTDIIYNATLQTRDYILRDFATYGDVIRIKLPYLQSVNSQTRNQYLWIENHQIKPTSIEFNENLPKGIRFNIQVGNDELTENLFNSRTNYLVPLSSFGNYDYYFDTSNIPASSNFTMYYSSFAYDSMSNPFGGYHPAMMPAIDYDEDNEIKPKEFIVLWKMYLENVLKINNWTVYGNIYDAFPVGSKINISSNPPTTPLMTFKTGIRPSGQDLGVINPTPAHDDNRYIWLNGLSIEIIEENSDGNVRVRISFNDYKIDSNVRWCGPIMLSDRAELQSSKTINIDYGSSPTRPNSPSLINGRKVFAAPTIFICKNNSYFKQESNSAVNVKNSSTLVLDSGSFYEVGDHAVLNIYATGTLQIKSGATLKVKGTGHVEIQRDAYICIEDGATIELVDELSALNLRTGYHLGLNPEVFPQQSNCTSTQLTNFTLSPGSAGQIHEPGPDRFIQDTIIMGNAYETGHIIWAGHHVTTQKPHGDVILENGAHVILDAEKDVKLEPGVKVNQGAILEVR